MNATENKKLLAEDNPHHVATYRVISDNCEETEVDPLSILHFINTFCSTFQVKGHKLPFQQGAVHRKAAAKH